MANSDYFYYLAVGTTVLSSVTVALLLFAIPTIYLKAQNERSFAAMKSARFRVRNRNIIQTRLYPGKI